MTEQLYTLRVAAMGHIDAAEGAGCDTSSLWAGVEVDAAIKEEKILRSLGIRHLDEKATRCRRHKDETAESILEKAGVSYVKTKAYRESKLRLAKEERKKELGQKMNMATLTRRQVEILRDSGVEWLDQEDMTYCLYDSKCVDKLAIDTCTTATTSLAESTVSTVYAEKELMRRLKRGWTNLPCGKVCGNPGKGVFQQCGMPLIQKNGLVECVVCGVVGDDDYKEYADVNAHRDRDDATAGVIDIATAVSTLTPHPSLSFDRLTIVKNDQDTNFNEPAEEKTSGLHAKAERTKHLSPVAENLSEDVGKMFSGQPQRFPEEDEDTMEALGRMLFEGWSLSSEKCPHCQFSLIVNGKDKTCVKCDNR